MLVIPIYMNNIPLAYALESKLGASQIQCLSEHALFYFDIKYQTGYSNRVTDALSYHPFNPTCDIKSESVTDSDKIKVILYSSVCVAIDQCLSSTKIPEDLKQDAQNISCAVQSIVEEKNKDEIVSTLNAVSILSK